MRCPLRLEGCYLDDPDPVVLDHATVPRIVLSRCRVVGGLTANLLVVTKELDLRGSAFEDVVGLVGDGMKVGGDLFLGQEFTAAGAVSVSAARIGGTVWAQRSGPRRTGCAMG